MFNFWFWVDFGFLDDFCFCFLKAVDRYITVLKVFWVNNGLENCFLGKKKLKP